MAEPHAVGLESLDGLLRKAARFTEISELSSMADKLVSSMADRLGVKVHLHILMESMKKIQALLSAADQTQISAPAARRFWLKKVNYLYAKADDLLDGFAYEARRPGQVEGHQDKKKRNKVRNFFSGCNSSVITRRKQIRRFMLVISMYRVLAHEARRIGLDLPERGVDATAKFEQILRTTDYSSVVESHMFQVGGDSLKLKEMLLSAGNDRDLSFVSIVGMGGTGKTTLARVVFNDNEVVNHFDVRMWVYVGRKFSIKRILKSLAECLTYSGYVVPNWVGKEGIVCYLRDALEGKKCLLVLDDVCEEDSQLTGSLKGSLLALGGSRGSKILVTTSSEGVAQLLQPGSSYRVVPREEDCLKLFRQIAFAPGGPEMTTGLKETGEAIVRKCEGHLLAIKTIGGLLYTKKDEEEWNSIATSDTWDIDDPIPGALLLSYIHLPSISLKQCFLYCSIFPRGSVMEKDELIQLWKAQGLLNPPQGSGLSEEVLGAKYLDILVRTSFLENAEQDEGDRRKFYKMHDRLHELASSLSKDQCSIMLGTDIEANDLKLAAHMTLINCEAEILKSLRGKEKLRTLRLENSGVLGESLAYTTSLRVLIVVDWFVDELPDSVRKLKLLHYLDISETCIRKLPDSISELYNLQTLRLYDLIELPKNYENLVSLTDLYIETFDDFNRLSALPPQFQKVINPSSFKACFKAYLDSKCPIEKLGTLLERPDLYYRLSIYRLENVGSYEKAEEAKLSSMSRIECLRLHWNARRENNNDEDVLDGLRPHEYIKNLAIENYKGSAFPLWMGKTSQQLTRDQLAEMKNRPTLNQLVKLELEDCSCCEHVPPLGHLPYLEIVKMQGMVNVKSIGAEFYGFTNVHDQCSTSSSAWTARPVFPKLSELTLREMTSLEEWSEPANLSNHSSSVCPLLEKFEVEQCPKLKRLPNVMTTSRRLRRLEVAMCDRLECLPEGVGGLKSLEELDIRGLPSLSQLSIGCFDSLKTLTIGGLSGAPEVDCNGQQTSLYLKGGDGKVAFLPEQLQYLSALEIFTISGYGGLKTLPKWFSKLQSLQILKLEFCGKLEHFPEAEEMQQLKNLDELDICYCPLLEARCTKGSRPELYKISHIPRIMINSEEIKFHQRNKNKNTTNTQTQRNKKKDIEKSGNPERNEGEGEQQGRSAASSSSQPADQSAGVGNEETLIKDSASAPKPSQQQELTAIVSNSTDDVPSVESKDKGKGKAKLSAQTVVGGPPSRGRGIVINEGGFKERAGAGSDRMLYKDSASLPSPSLSQEKTAVASDSDDDVPVSANPSAESKGEDKSKSAGAGNERMLVQDSASLPNPPQQQEITAIGYDSNDDKPSTKSKDEVMAKLPTPTAVGGVSSDTYGIFNDENASKKVELSKVVVNEFSESSGAGNKRTLVKGSKSPPSLPQKQEITAVGFNSDDDVPVLAKPYVESKHERPSRLPALTTVNGVSSYTIGIEIEKLASIEFKLSKESVNEYVEISGAGNGRILVKGSTTPIYPPPHQEITAFGSNSDHAVPVQTVSSVESEDEDKSRLPTLNVVGGVSSDISCTAMEVKASKEVELSKELATEFSESAGTGREKMLVKGNIPLISPPQQQVMNTMGSDSDDDAWILAKHFYQMKR